MKKMIMLASLILSTAFITAAETRNHQAVPLEGKIIIDGKLDEPAWKKAPQSKPLIGMVKGEKVPEEIQTVFKVVYSDEGVYFGILANEPDTAKIKATSEIKDTMATFGDDHIEIFIDQIGDRVEYCQFAVSVSNAKTDYYRIEAGNTGKSGYNPTWEAKTFIGKNYYSMECFIPFAALFNRKLRSGKQDWIFSITRQLKTRKKMAEAFTVFNSSGNNLKGFHNLNEWGKLKGIEIPAKRYVISGENPVVNTLKTSAGYSAICSINLLNRADEAREVIVQATLDGKSSKVVKTLPKSKLTTVELPAITVAELDKNTVTFSVLESDGERLLFKNTAKVKLEYQPIILKMKKPVYRNNIYFTQDIKEIIGAITLNLPASQLKAAKVTILFKDQNSKTIFLKKYPVKAASKVIDFLIPAGKLQIGTYDLTVTLVDASGKTQAAISREISKLPNAPGVEVRVDKSGKTIINGVPIFIRGFMGNHAYLMSRVSMVVARVPSCVNFMQGAETRMRIFRGIGMSRLPGLEKTAIAEKSLSEETKKAALKIIETNKYNRNAIFYYLSDEPECRGLSPETLKELYELIKKTDPYRMCMIVSRSPAKYWQSCDVISPHPYNNPIINEKGKQVFTQDFADIHRKMQEGYKAIDGRAKGLWVTPQVFSYAFTGMSPTSVEPNFEQARWSIMSGVANHANGVMSFMFSNYWNDIGNRIGVTYVYETLAWLEVPWMEGIEQKVKTKCANEGNIDVIVKKHVNKGISHIYIVATNRTDKTFNAEFSISGLEKFKRMYVLRENRSISIKNGQFTDEFGKNGVHIYTTCDALPYFKSLKEIKSEIAAVKTYPKTGKNLLRNGKINWQRGMNGRDNRIYGDSLADGNLDSPGWLPWYGNRKELNLVFPNGIKFSKFSFYSHNIKVARLQVWSFGKWREIAKWDDIHKSTITWQGEMQDTVKLRLLIDKVKLGRNTFAASTPCITEIEMEK